MAHGFRGSQPITVRKVRAALLEKHTEVAVLMAWAGKAESSEQEQSSGTTFRRPSLVPYFFQIGQLPKAFTVFKMEPQTEEQTFGG